MGLFLPASKAVLAAPFVPSGPVTDVSSDIGKICDEGEGGKEESGMEAHMKTCTGEKQAHVSILNFYF